MTWLTDLALSLVVPVAAAVFSLPLRRLAAARRLDLPADLALACGLACALASAQAAGMLLGFTHALRPLPAAALLLTPLLAALALGRRELPGLGRGAAALVPSLALLAPVLLMATFPPWDRDEMVYHLALPRQFALAGGYVRPDDNIFASLPLGWETIEALLHTLGRAPGEPAFNPRLLGAWTAWGAALAASALAREAGAVRRPWLAGALLLLTPTFVEFGASAYVEPYLVLAVTLALVAAARAGRGEDGLAGVAGALVGLGASIKYTGLMAAVPLALALLLAPGAPRDRARSLARFAALAALVAAPFYVRNLIERGNPVFPMAYDLLGGRGWDDTRAALYWDTLRGYGAGETVVDALTAPARVFFARDMARGFEGSIGPLALLGLALGVGLAARPADDRPAPRQLALFAAVFTLLWSLSVVQARFYLVAVPPLLALLAAGAERWAPSPLAAGALLAAAAAWGLGGVTHLWTRQPTSAWLAGRLTVDQALTQVLPQSYAPLRQLDEVVPPGTRVWLVWMRGYTYHLRRPYRLDSVFEEWRLAALLDEARGADDVRERLRAEGIGHLLINERFFLRNGSSDLTPGRTERLRQRFGQMVAAGALRPARRWDEIVLYEVTKP